MIVACADYRNQVQEECANCKNGRCMALTETSSDCSFYKPKSQWKKELAELEKRERLGKGYRNQPWGKKYV